MNSNTNPTLRFSIYDGIAWALMIGFGESFFSAYAIFLMATPTQIALLGAFPAFIPSIAQLAGVRLMNLYQSRKALVVNACFMHALGLLPIALIGVLFYPDFHDGLAANLMIAFAVIYFFFGAVGVPAWSSMLGDIVPANSRGSYFGFRNKKIAYASFFALIIAGPILAYFKQNSLEAEGFFLIFIIALIARMISVYWLTKHIEPVQQKSESAYFSFYEFIKRTPHSNFAKFAWFVCLMLFGHAICGPFFSVYLLRELKFSYIEFTALSGCLILSQVFTLTHWGELSDKFGNKAILFMAALGICIAPLLWVFSANFYYLVFVHFFSGFVWAGFNLAITNFLLDAVTPAKRARCAAYQSVLNGICTLSGSMLGAYLLSHPSASFADFMPDAGGKAKFFMIILLSVMVRSAVLLIFCRRINEVREVQSISGKDLIFKIINIRAISGFSFSFDSKKD